MGTPSLCLSVFILINHSKQEKKNVYQTQCPCIGYPLTIAFHLRMWGSRSNAISKRHRRSTNGLLSRRDRSSRRDICPVCERGSGAEYFQFWRASSKV